MEEPVEQLFQFEEIHLWAPGEMAAQTAEVRRQSGETEARPDTPKNEPRISARTA